MKKRWGFIIIFCIAMMGCAQLEPAWQDIPGKWTQIETMQTDTEEISSDETDDTETNIAGHGGEAPEGIQEHIEGQSDSENKNENNETKENESKNIEQNETVKAPGQRENEKNGEGENQSENQNKNQSQNENGQKGGNYDGDEIESRIAVATDIHYLAKELTDGGKSFQDMLNRSDGMLTQYCWEIVMAFLEEMESEKPDILILSGDLTKNGEKKSHEELAKRLRKLEQAGVPVIVIPGNHDINSPYASGFRKDGEYSVQEVSPKQFAAIYKDFGYKEALERDAYSLSYVYELNEYTWILMLDSCQYSPKHLVGGMIQEGTYSWIEDVLEKAWEEGVRVIPVSHHNLLEQTNASEEFVRNCTIEHDERLIRMWEENQINLHLSGHLHIQHYEQTEEEQPAIYEIVTGALSMYPCNYGILEIMNHGDIYYQTKRVPVEKWAKKYKKTDYNLLNFEKYAEEFLYDISYWSVYKSLQSHGLSVFQSEIMAKLYARLNPNFYAGTIPNERESILRDPAYELWKDSEYFSEAATTIQTVIEEENHDYNTLYISY